MQFTGKQWIQAIEKIEKEKIRATASEKSISVSVIGSNGVAYTVNRYTLSCSCPAGKFEVPCKHVAAAAIAGFTETAPSITGIKEFAM